MNSLSPATEPTRRRIESAAERLPLHDTQDLTTRRVDGDPAILASLVGVVAPVDPDFAVVTP